ncbi:hypothetical protein SAMN06296386_11210 [Lachnospiraceae bacterium]|nr:hypothetical protein SAMN06296386_11210 [Lachnospiraceae bacterium]
MRNNAEKKSLETEIIKRQINSKKQLLNIHRFLLIVGMIGIITNLLILSYRIVIYGSRVSSLEPEDTYIFYGGFNDYADAQTKINNWIESVEIEKYQSANRGTISWLLLFVILLSYSAIYISILKKSIRILTKKYQMLS